MNNPKFRVFKSALNGQYYYHLQATNGEKILSGEGYTSKQSCLSGIASVQANAPYDTRYDKFNRLNNYTFNLKGANGEIIGRSENYTTLTARDNGIAAVKKDAPLAGTEDVT